jgi:hypothetical protein
MKPTINSILWQIEQVNPQITAHWRGRSEGFLIKALVQTGVVMRSVILPVFIGRLSAECFRC